MELFRNGNIIAETPLQDEKGNSKLCSDFLVGDLMDVYISSGIKINADEIVYIIFTPDYYEENKSVLDINKDIQEVMSKYGLMDKIYITRVPYEKINNEKATKVLSSLACLSFVELNTLCDFEQSLPMIYLNKKSLPIIEYMTDSLKEEE